MYWSLNLSFMDFPHSKSLKVLSPDPDPEFPSSHVVVCYFCWCYRTGLMFRSTARTLPPHAPSCDSCPCRYLLRVVPNSGETKRLRISDEPGIEFGIILLRREIDSFVESFIPFQY